LSKKYQITQLSQKSIARDSYKHDPNISLSVTPNRCPFSPSSYSTCLTSRWLYVIILDTTHSGYRLASNTSDRRYVDEYTLRIGVELSLIVSTAEQQMSSKVNNTIWQLHALFSSYRPVNQRLSAKIRSHTLRRMKSLAQVSFI
jgi:hypothetical protein